MNARTAAKDEPTPAPSNLKWYPSDYCEETSPDGRSCASDWIEDYQGNSILAPFYEGDDGEAQILSHGDVINFVTCSDYGTATLTLADDRSWRVSSPMPHGADQCCIMDGYQIETLSTSVNECARELIDAGGEPGFYIISYYTFSGPTPMRFDQHQNSFEAVI